MHYLENWYLTVDVGMIGLEVYVGPWALSENTY